jgi:hypothetical protein
MSTTPSIGRIVHYVSYGTPGGEYPRACRAAVITEVGEFTIGLAVLNPSGLFFDQGLPYREPVEGQPMEGGTWHWPERVPDDHLPPPRHARETVDVPLPPGEQR